MYTDTANPWIITYLYSQIFKQHKTIQKHKNKQNSVHKNAKVYFKKNSEIQK